MEWINKSSKRKDCGASFHSYKGTGFALQGMKHKTDEDITHPTVDSELLELTKEVTSHSLR